MTPEEKKAAEAAKIQKITDDLKELLELKVSGKKGRMIKWIVRDIGTELGIGWIDEVTEKQNQNPS